MGLLMEKETSGNINNFRLFSIEDVAFLLEKKENSIKKYKQDDKLKSKKILGDLKFTFDDIKSFLIENSENLNEDEADFLLRSKLKELDKKKENLI